MDFLFGKLEDDGSVADVLGVVSTRTVSIPRSRPFLYKNKNLQEVKHEDNYKNDASVSTLTLSPPFRWIDTFIPHLRQAGGFTITSTPAEARPSSHSPSYIELAVQKSKNPPAQWLWRPKEEILNTQLAVRVGGSFTWPPEGLDTRKIERLVLVAGGVGIK